MEAYAQNKASQVYAGQVYAGAVGSTSVTTLSPVVRLAAAVEAAEKAAALIHSLRIHMMGDVPAADKTVEEYRGEGLLGRITDAACRIEAATSRIARDVEDMHRAYGDF